MCWEVSEKDVRRWAKELERVSQGDCGSAVRKYGGGLLEICGG